MSLLPAYFGRKRNDDLAPLREPESETRNDVFSLIPARADDLDDKPDTFAKHEKPSKTEAPPKPEGRNVRSLGMTDLGRLSIDNDGRLYWDGKPVEVRRRIMMSRTQTIGAVIVSAFIVVGAIGAIIQGTAAAHDWACKLGWAKSYCGPSAPERPQVRTDIPA